MVVNLELTLGTLADARGVVFTLLVSCCYILFIYYITIHLCLIVFLFQHILIFYDITQKGHKEVVSKSLKEMI